MLDKIIYLKSGKSFVKHKEKNPPWDWTNYFLIDSCPWNLRSKHEGLLSNENS